MVSRVEQDYDARGLNSPSQFGFKASLFAENAICKTLGTSKNTNKKFVLLLFIDIQGAFDNLWWPSILLRLIKVGISSYMFDTLKDYFSGRSVSLMAEDRSMMISRETERGCPQGSIVGPYAWRWCMDELLNDARREWSSDTVEWVAYADDIVIAVKGNSRFKLERLSERCLSYLMSWCGRYKLRLSTPNTKCILIKGHMDRSRMPWVLCAGERIECVRQYKYLGVILDSVPNFVEHAKWVRAKVSTYMFSLKTHVGRGWGIQRRMVETLYDIVCIPMIAYGREEWAKSMTKSHVRRHLNALHRLLLLTLTRGRTFASTVSLEVVAGRMLLDLAVCLWTWPYALEDSSSLQKQSGR